MAQFTIPGNSNFDMISGSGHATIDRFNITNEAQFLIDTDTRYCTSRAGSAATSNGSLDIITSLTGTILIDGTAIKMIPYMSGSGTAPALTSSLAISSLAYSNNVVTCITTLPHALALGTNVHIRVGGVTPNSYNGVFGALVTSTTGTVYYLPSDPGLAVVTNARMVNYPKVSQVTGSIATITAASTAGTIAPYTSTFTAANHGFTSSSFVTVAGSDVTSYNGRWQVISASTNEFTVWTNAPAAAATTGTAQKNVYGHFLAFFSSFTAVPVPAGIVGGGTVPARGWCKVKNVSGGDFYSGSLFFELGTNPSASAIAPQRDAWIEVAGPETATATVSRLGTFRTTGSWFYPTHIPVAITSASWATGSATYWCTNTFASASQVNIVGAMPVGYNGEFLIKTAAATNFVVTMSASPGTYTNSGDVLSQIRTSGVANQTIQLPAPVLNTVYPGAWIETASGSNSFEYWPVCNIAAAASTVATTEAQGELLWMSTQGLLRLSNDGTNNNGYVPPSGCRIRVPNIVTTGITKSAITGAATNNAGPATVTGRYTFTTTGGGVIDLRDINWRWNSTFAQAYSVNLQRVSVVDAVGAISEIASPMVWVDVGIGTPGAATQAGVASLAFSLCFAGGTFTNVKSAGHVATSGTTAQAKNTMADCYNFSFSNFKLQTYPIRRSATSTVLTMTRCGDCDFTTYKAIGALTSLTTCARITFTSSSYADLTSGVTGTGTGTYFMSITANSNTIMVNGVNFWGITNVNPYLGVFQITAGAQNIKIRNIGTAAQPLSLGPTNASAYFVVGAASAGCRNLEFKRIYTQNTRTGIASNIDNSYSNVEYANCWFDGADTFSPAALNTTVKGMRAAAATTLNTAVYGTHFADYFPTASIQTGHIVFIANEATTLSSGAYSIDVASTGSNFNSANAYYMPAVGDQITWTHPHYVLGHPQFATGSATEWINGAATTNNLDLFYDIDVGSGFSGSFKNLSYKRSGAGGTSGNSWITMTSTTGVASGNYVYGTNVAPGAKVTTINSATSVSSSLANIGTVSGILKFNDLPNVPTASIDASTGFKLKVRAVTNAASTTNLLQFITIPTLVTSASMGYQYPLETYDLNIEIRDGDGALITSACEVTIVNASGESILYNEENVTTGLSTYSYEYSADVTAYINIMNVGTYEPKTVSPVTLSDSDQTIIIQLDLERGKYNNP